MSDQEYTTAVIVAVPAADDPVHAVVAEDAHITLFFLGEAAELPAEGIEEIQAALGQLTEALYPFPAKISGVAELGEDAAKVLLIESFPLTKIRELMGTVPAVDMALAATADKQFPNWIPHLTLTYEDESPDVSPYDTVQLSGLELWLGGEKTSYPFQKSLSYKIETEPTVASAKNVTVTITAAVGKFDPSLHPRGADGRFIEKFGIIKYLQPKGTWAYGKVEGIEKDETGTVMVTVTPSSLTGIKLSGEPKELLPKQIYRAPKAKAHLTTKAIGAQKIGGQGGSNPGGLYSIPKSGSSIGQGGVVSETEKFYVKTPKSKAHGANEALANHLYEEAGVPVPEVDVAEDGQLYSKIIEGQQDMAQKLSDPAWADQIRRNFAVDAWLGNRDVFGMTYDNILTDEAGTAWRIDNGGALLYRAMGAKKDDFGGKVTELDSFRTGKKAKIFGSGMSKIQELDGAQRVLAILPDRIEEMVAEAGLPKSLADTLKARRAYIADYYGLELPEASKPAGAQEGTSAPLVDAADLAKHKGKPRDWFKVKLHQAALLLSTGDTVEVSSTIGGTGATDQLKYGVDMFGAPLSGLGAQAQLLGWQQTYGADAEVMFRKASGSGFPRPAHGSKLKASDLSTQNWQRGDKLIGQSGTTWTVKGANPANGAVLLESPNDGSTLLLDTHGKDGAGLWEIQRWDPPAVETPVDAVQAPSPAAKDYSWIGEEAEHSKQQKAMADILDSPELAEMSDMPSQEDSAQAVDTPPPGNGPTPPVTIAEPKEKTGQAAEAEAAIKADLDAPMPTGNGAPEPKKTSAKSGEKKMLIGDGTEATPGADLVSKKDGKSYVFVKPKGQYAVVTDPNGEDPEKQLLKLASTMTQPGAEAVVDDLVGLPTAKTATGEVPALGMFAKAKDGHEGTITMISPDGKFVFITDANGKKKRKSTGTVSITGGTPAVADAPKVIPGPVKDYGPAPAGAFNGTKTVMAHLNSATSQELVHVGYADGSSGLEPYSGQPLEVLETNATGQIAIYGYVESYLGPIDSKQFAQGMEGNTTEEFGTQAVFTAVWNGTIFQTNGMTGPNGGLILFDASDPNDYAMELPPEGGQTIQLVEKKNGSLPAWDMVTSPQAHDGAWTSNSAPLYGEEAKTLAGWKGEISQGMEISLDGISWMKVAFVGGTGSLIAEDSNGVEATLSVHSPATYVLKAPSLTNGDALDSTWQPEVIPATDVTGQPEETAATKAPSFLGYTPGPGETVISWSAPDGTKTYYVHKPGFGENGDNDYGYWQSVYPHDGSLNEAGLSRDEVPPGFGNGYGLEWPLADEAVDTPAGSSLFDAKAKQVLVTDLVPGDVIDTADGLEIVSSADGQGQFTVIGGAEAVTLNPTWTVGVLGNAFDGPVDMNMHQVMPLLKPGFTVDSADGIQLTVASYPAQQADGSWLVATITNGNPNDLELVSTNHFGEHLSLPVYMGAQTTVMGLGVDPEALDSLFNAYAHMNTPIDHHTQMTNVGIPFGTAQHPVFFDAEKNVYVRSGPEGKLEVWDTGKNPAAWTATDGTTAGMTKVWDGKPFEGNLKIPAGTDLALYGVETATYKPKPGEAVAVTTLPSGNTSALVVSPSGSFAEGQMVHTVTKDNQGNVVLSSTSYDANQVQGAYGTLTVIHDPFAEPTAESPWQHQDGEMPQAAADAFAQKNMSPEPGTTYLIATPNEGDYKGVFKKSDDGKWLYVNSDGTPSANDTGYTQGQMQESFNSNSDMFALFTWTAPGGVEKKPVPGLPSGYAPFVPGEGQSVLKVTTPAGKETVLVQQQPGSGWYVMDASGVINESSDAVKSDYVVQKYLAGNGNAKAGTKYELLHPAAPGADPVGTPGEMPSFEGYQVMPGEKVLKLGSPGDPEPWFFVQSEPGGLWKRIFVDEDGDAYFNLNDPSGSYAESTVQTWLTQEDTSHLAIVWEGTKNPLAEDPDAAPSAEQSFSGYTPKPGEKVYAEPNGSHWVFTPADGKYHAVEEDGTLAPSFAMTQAEWDLAAQNTPSPQVWPAAVDTAADAPAAGGQGFDGYTPKPGEKVVGESNDFWVQKEPGGEWLWIIKNGDQAGQLKTTGPVSDSAMQSYIANGTSPVVFGGDDAATTTFKAPGASVGYTPKTGETVKKDENGEHWVQQEPGGSWFMVKDDGTLSFGSMGNGAMQAAEDEYMTVWPVDTAIAPGGQGIVVKGYQTKSTDNVVELTYPQGQPLSMVYSPEHDQWLPILDGGEPGIPGEDGFTPSTIEWALSSPTVTVNVLQGLPKGTPASADPKPLTEEPYAGVSSLTLLTSGSYGFDGYTPTAEITGKIEALGMLTPGESLYVVDNTAKGPGYESQVWLRGTSGQRYQITPSGNKAPDVMLTSDAAWDAFIAGQAEPSPVYKLKVTAPTAAPVVKKPYVGPAISGWSQAGVPDPTAFNAISDASEGKGAKAGSWIYMTANGTGLMMQLGKDWDGTEEFYPQKVHTVGNNSIAPNAAITYTDLNDITPWKFVPTNQFYIQGDPAAPSAAPASAPSWVQDAPAVAPAAPAPKPSYPGALAPSQEDINAWGGSLTKDGHIPAPGMFVSGKGPMSGKIISVSKDKTKAVVLKGDGTKTTRLIEALKTDKSANYSAYAAPATAKDIPAGMPLAVDTVAEALDKTAKDGKFRAILNGHPGVSGGQMVVTKTTAPSGKVFNRVHLTLTPAQRELLVAMLSGTGEKGDWVTSSKMSDAIAIGDELPMRKSSTDNPDGTPRWKVDPETKPPTHTVSKIEDDPSGSGVKIVTLKNKTTGELVTSRFHPGKSVTIYNWDPNKPKAMAAGAFSLSESAKGIGWTKVNDGGISAIKGGAENGKLYHEPGSSVSKGVFQDASHSWETLRNVSDDGVVIELIGPKDPNKNSTTGATVISVPEGVDETALGAALAKLGVDYRPMTQDDAKVAVRGTLRTLLNLDISDVDTAKGWSDEKLFAQAGQSMGISDLGWQDVLIGVDESTGKASFFWSDRARNALASKTSYNLIYRAASSGTADQVVQTVKYGSANSVLKRTTGMIDTPSGVGTGASWSSDYSNHAGHGSYSSAGSKSKLPTSNGSASYKSSGMMVYSRPEAVLGRIADFRVSGGDAFGMGQGSGSDHLKHATTMSSVKDFFIGGGLPTESVGFIAVQSASARNQAIEKLKADGFATVNGRPVEEIVILMSDAEKMKPSDLPPVTLPANARPILDLPTSYDTPAVAPAGEAA